MNDTDAATVITNALQAALRDTSFGDVVTSGGIGAYVAAHLRSAGLLTDGIDWESDAEQLHAALQASPVGRHGTDAGTWWRDTGSPACINHQVLREQASA